METVTCSDCKPELMKHQGAGIPDYWRVILCPVHKNAERAVALLYEFLVNYTPEHIDMTSSSTLGTRTDEFLNNLREGKAE